MGKVLMLRRRVIPRPRQKIPMGRRRLRSKSMSPKRTFIFHKGKRILYKWRTQPPHPLGKRFWNPFSIFKGTTDFWRSMRRIWGIKKTRTWSKKKEETWKPSKSVAKKVKRDYTREKEEAKKLFKSPQFKKFSKEHLWKLSPSHPRNFNRSQGYGSYHRNKQRGGRRLTPHPWTGTNKFGKMKEIDPHLIFNLKPTPAFYKWLKSKDATTQRSIKDLMRVIKNKLMKYAIYIITEYVPIETGDLQKSMIESLGDSKVSILGLKMEMEADVKYANVVNNMPERMIQHPKKIAGVTVWEYGRRSGSKLYDPKAQKGSYWLILMLLKTKARELVKDFAKNLLTKVYSGLKPTGYRRRKHGWAITRVQAGESSYTNWWATWKNGKRIKRKNPYGWQKKQNTPAGRVRRIGPNPLLDEDEKLIRMNKWRATKYTEESHRAPVAISQDLIKTWFKIEGLKGYKKLR